MYYNIYNYIASLLFVLFDMMYMFTSRSLSMYFIIVTCSCIFWWLYCL